MDDREGARVTSGGEIAQSCAPSGARNVQAPPLALAPYQFTYRQVVTQPDTVIATTRAALGQVFVKPS